MVMLATRAVRAPDGTVLGHIQGGLLLNRNLPFIDHINEIVYPEGSLPFGSRGTATLFLDDVRISTNVRLFGPAQDERAIGTRVSQAVRDAVLGRGLTWLDRAFVVNDWYVSAYQPLADGAGRRVGMLYVGYLERPFTLLKYGVLVGIGVIFFAVMIVAAFVSLRWARTIFRPLEQMEATMRRVEAGDADARVGAGRQPTTRSAAWPSTWTTCSASSTRTPARCSAGTPSSMPRSPNARASWRRRSRSCCAAKSWPPSASSRPASRTRSTTRSR